MVSVNARGLRSDSKRIRLRSHLEDRGVDICVIQETHFDSSFHEDILSGVYEPFSAFFDGRSRGVTWLVSRSLKASCTLVFSDPQGRLCVLDITIKGKVFRLIGVYGPNTKSELPDFFRGIEPYMTSARPVILAGDWNAVLDPSIDRGGARRDTNNLDSKRFRNFVQRFDLVDKFRELHPNRVEWTWTGRGASGQLSSYIDRVLVRRVDLDLIGGPSFQAYNNFDHRFVYFKIRLDRPKVRMSGYWKFNASLLEDKNFQDRLAILIQRELTGAILGNHFWSHLKDSIRSFAADYSRRLTIDRLTAQKTLQSKIDRAVLAGDSIATNIAKAELAATNNNRYQALVVRARLKRMSGEATTMAQELRAEEMRFASDRHITSVTSPDGQRRTTNEGICSVFRDYYQDLFTREPGLSSSQFDTYLADFPRLTETEAAGCEGRITEDEVREALKTVGKNKTPGIDGLPYEVYLRLSHMFVPLLTAVYNNWMKQGSIPQRFTRGIVKLLRKNKHGGEGLSNFRPLTMLNTDLKILAKILADRLQSALPSLISPEQSCAVKGRTIQDSLHLIRTIIDKVDNKAALINLDQSKAFDRVDHSFLEAVLSAAGFGVDFRTWIRLMYASPGVMVEVNGVRSKPFTLSRSIRQGCPLSPMLYVLALEPFLLKLRANPVLRGITLPGASVLARYTAYADDVSLLVTSISEIEEVQKEIGRYEEVTGARINREKSVGLRLGSWKGSSLPGPFSWTDGPCKILGVWFGPDLQLEKNWSEVIEKVVATTGLWSRRRLSLKGKAEVCGSHIYPLILYRLSVLPLPVTYLVNLERALFQFIWGRRAPMVRREICFLHPSEGGLGVPNVETRRHTLRLTFLGRMCAQHDETGDFWKEDAKRAFPALKSVHSDDGREAHRLPRNECSFYRECRQALRVFSRVQPSLNDTRPLTRKALYQILVRGAVRDDLLEELGVTKQEGRLLWPWAPGMRSLNNDEASLTWLVIRKALWVSKRLWTAGLVASQGCFRCGDLEETIAHVFFHCPEVKPMCNYLERLMVRMLHGKFFVLEAASVCSNVVPVLDRQIHYVFLCLLGVMRVVIWTTWKKGFYGGEFFTSRALVAFFRHQIEVKLKCERERLSSIEFGERWVKASQMCLVKGTTLNLLLDV